MDGSCHCGSAHWRLEAVPARATACNCSICRRYGALWGYGFYDEQITLSGDTRLYLWGRKRIEFHFCARCGCVLCWQAATPGEDGRRWGAVNLRMADDPGWVQSIVLMHHDSENDTDRSEDGQCVADVWA